MSDTPAIITANRPPNLLARDPRPRTDWFQGTVRPARPGVYERQIRLAPYSFWNGRTWGLSSQTPETARLNARVPSLRQDERWRGLAQEAQTP